MSRKACRNGLLYIIGILTCTLYSFVGSVIIVTGLLYVPKKESSKHSILNLCLKSEVVIELEYVCVLTLQCTIVVKAFWVLVKILGF